MVSKTEWVWTNEYGRAHLLREELEYQSQMLADANRRHQREASKIRSELAAVRGSLETRLTALTNAFVTFVELDGIRTQLTTFPEHARARRLALEDLLTLFDGELPPERPDVDEYWLPPAVAALRPDGSIGQDLAALAHSRDPEVAMQFLTIARAALGAGSDVVGELPRLLAPDDEGAWAGWQVLTWATILRGAFGSGVLAVLSDTFRPLLAASDDWLAWARQQVSESASDAEVLDWVTQRVEELTPEGTAAEEAGWTATAAGAPDFLAAAFTPRPFAFGTDSERRSWLRGETERPEPEQPKPAGPDFVPAGEEAPAEPEPVTELTELAADDAEASDVGVELDGVDTVESTRAMLVKALRVHINEGVEGEQELLARAAQLEKQLENLLEVDVIPEEVSDERHDVVAMVRKIAIDTHASRQDRRVLWGLIGEQFKTIARGFVNEMPPAPPVQTIPGRDLQVDPNGPRDPARLRKLLQDAAPPEPTGVALHGKQLFIGGVVAVGVTWLLMFLVPSWLWILVLVAEAGIAYYGYSASRVAQIQREQAEARQKALQTQVDQAVATVAQKHNDAIEAHQARVAASQRLIAAVGIGS
ncbi:MAG: hypothetical protein Q4D79_08045 [Propionibacteriaceae bacterium]|nr:hypothetical protein [Propionibacteriaceae bacterium]